MTFWIRVVALNAMEKRKTLSVGGGARKEASRVGLIFLITSTSEIGSLPNQ